MKDFFRGLIQVPWCAFFIVFVWFFLAIFLYVVLSFVR